VSRINKSFAIQSEVKRTSDSNYGTADRQWNNWRCRGKDNYRENQVSAWNFGFGTRAANCLAQIFVCNPPNQRIITKLKDRSLNERKVVAEAAVLAAASDG